MQSTKNGTNNNTNSSQYVDMNKLNIYSFIKSQLKT